VLEAFSAALKILMVQLRQAAGRPSGELETFVMPERTNRHTSRQGEVILHMVRVLLNDDAAQPRRTNHAPLGFAAHPSL
jgi:hypothetical protein